jgi:hypothetical protein
MYKQAEDARQIAGLGQNLSSENPSSSTHKGQPLDQNLHSEPDHQSNQQPIRTASALSSHGLPRGNAHAEFVAGRYCDDEILEEQRTGIDRAKLFRDKYYPAYIKLYDSISERQIKGETVGQDELDKVWKMHKSLEELKREIAAAAKRGEA